MDTGQGAASEAGVRREWTDAMREAFLHHLAETANVSLSVRRVGMTTAALYRMRARDAGFRTQWAEALRAGYARLELVVLERAIKGTRKPVFHGGKKVGTVTEYSDRLALALLSRHRGAVLGDDEPEEDEAAVRARLNTRIDAMAERMAAADAAD